MERTDAVVIGAGVVGLAIVQALAASGRSVLILEREAQFGTGTSARNSEVIHAGIYYPHGSHRERLCIAGKRMLYDWCAARGVAHRRLGKLTFAADAAERARLEAIAAHAFAAQADDELRWLEADEARGLEPALTVHAALLSPSSGIVDSHGLTCSRCWATPKIMAQCSRAARPPKASSGAARTGSSPRARPGSRPALSSTPPVTAPGRSRMPPSRSTRRRSRRASSPRGATSPTLAGSRSRRLIYPLPIKGGLGTHLTLDLAGQARFGPDVEWVETIDYAVDPSAKPRFLAAVRQFWREVDPDQLVPAYSGVRPKLAGPGVPDVDWLIEGPADHGLPGLVNLFGIDSPGLTASLAIGDYVRALLA